MLFKFVGSYLQFKSPSTGKKHYFAYLVHPAYGRISRQTFKRAGDAKSWAERWAERANLRSENKTAIVGSPEDYPGRNRIYITFE